MEFWLAVVLTALMGLSLGLLGGGGSILTIPILTEVLGMDTHPAIALSLILVGSTALLASGFHHRKVPLPWRDALTFALLGSPLAFAGAWMSRSVSGGVLLMIFSGLMLLVGGLMFLPRPETPAPHKRNWPLLIAAGAGVGFLTGFLGVGGGFVIVPALVLILGMQIKRAVGASLLIIAINAAVGVAGHWNSLEFHWELVLPLIAAALVGTFTGVEISKHFTPPNLRRAFAVFILVVGTFMVVRNLPALQNVEAERQAQQTQQRAKIDKIDFGGSNPIAITDGDFVHPAFSPDSKRLAYSGVIVRDGTELTEIFVRDLDSGETVRLLDSGKSEGYAVYKSFVISLEWKDDNTLVAEISDGDVDSTVVTIDVSRRKILSEEFGDSEARIPEFGPVGLRAKATFTEWPESVLGSALHQLFIQLGGEGKEESVDALIALIVQKRHAGEDSHIWRLDFHSGKATKIMDVPDGPNTPYARLIGGFGYKDSVVFGLQRATGITLYRHQEGTTDEVTRIDSTENSGHVDVKRSSWDATFFLLKRHRSYEQGHNPLFLYDASGLREVEADGDLYDATISPDGTLLCLALWRNGQRHLIVQGLPAPPQH